LSGQPIVTIHYLDPNVHEMFVLKFAERLGLYEEAGLDLHLAEGVGRNLSTDPISISLGLGGAAVSALQGAPWRIMQVFTDWPMFWLVSRSAVSSAAVLAGKRVGTYPAGSVPDLLTRLALRKHGLDLTSAVERIEFRDRKIDDGVKLAQVRSGELDAAIVGSKVPPLRWEQEGLHTVLGIGDAFRFATTGIAIRQDQIQAEDPLLQRFIAATGSALQQLREKEGTAIATIQAMAACTQLEAADYYQRFIRPHFRPDGCPTPGLLPGALNELAQELGLPSPDVSTLFDMRLLTN
jgi:ABC-type nitrate/sulfonate/bicarbonate transport system substrate-binding protein